MVVVGGEFRRVKDVELPDDVAVLEVIHLGDDASVRRHRVMLVPSVLCLRKRVDNLSEKRIHTFVAQFSYCASKYLVDEC